MDAKTQYELWSRELGSQIWEKVLFDDGDFDTLDQVLNMGRHLIKRNKVGREFYVLEREYKVRKVTVQDLGLVTLC